LKLLSLLLQDEIPSEIFQENPNGVDLILMLFSLSAISPSKMQIVVSKATQILRPGGRILFRDYGRYDEAQLRFSKGHIIEENFYVRQDGTRAYYFTTENLRDMFEGAGLQEIENNYIFRQYANRKQKAARYRVWIHAKFEKPFITP